MRPALIISSWDRALRTCDRQTLKTFGINVGYEACSKGPGACTDCP